MPTVLGSLRRLLLAPTPQEVTFSARGFPVAPTPATRRLEAIPQSVVYGFEWGLDLRDTDEAELRLDVVEPELRGFAYEGATMALTLLDVLRPGRGNRTRDLLLGPGRPHIFLTYIGIGFAMARVPRPVWRKIFPDLGPGTPYPAMSWFAVDGYGFDRAYFDTRRWVDEQRPAAPYPWENAPDYFPRAADQGIGRALWFIHGGRPDAVAAAIDRFADHRRPDLWSGAGLAAVFAGGCDAASLDALVRDAGGHAADLAQGAIFGAKGRVHSGHVPEHTEIGVTALAGLCAADAARLADARAVEGTDGTGVPAYERWRASVRARAADRRPTTA